MNGRSSKLDRLRGGSGGVRSSKRSSLPLPLRNRALTPSVIGVSTSNTVSAVTRGNCSPPPPPDEKFSLVSRESPPAFAMIIRLTPDLIDEITRLEAHGQQARIKFHSCANNSSGNVIDVGGKDIGFTWSSETGDLCDIYEELLQSGADENGLLVESGCAWRKLNVQRVLDESTTNHVKMRTEEAERKLKCRKAIVIDHGKPSLKGQTNSLGTAESDPKKITFQQKKVQTSTKQKVEPSQGVSAATPLKSTEQIVGIEKRNPSRAQGIALKNSVNNGKIGDELFNFKSMLISLLIGNPKGMSLKSLNKAVGDKMPNSTKEIQTIMKKIATYKAPGLYFLKPEVELELFKKPFASGGSSSSDISIFPEANIHHKHAENLSMHQNHVLQDNHTNQIPFSKSNIVEKIDTIYWEGAQSNSIPREKLMMSEMIDIQQQSFDLLNDKNASDNRGGPASSYSNMGGDNSDSGAESQSHSESTVESGSESSSDSEKEEVDEDVDVMAIDDAEDPKLELGASVQSEIEKKHYDHGFNAVGIKRVSTNGEESEFSVPPVEYTKSSSPNHDEKEKFVKDSFERNPKRSKRYPDLKQFDEELGCTKRLKTGSVSHVFNETKLCPLSLTVGVSTNSKTVSERTLVKNVEDNNKTSNFIRADPAKERTSSHILADVNNKFRQNGSKRNQDIGSQGCRANRKENRMTSLCTVSNYNNELLDETFLQCNGVQKRKNTFSDEDVSSYFKYEKDEPELRGPINDFSQYEEYVQEFRYKYASYCSMDKTLNIERNHFRKLGENLELFKSVDVGRYNNLVGQLKDSYHQYGLRHKRLKKVFVVLHEELQSLKQRIKDFAVKFTDS